MESRKVGEQFIWTKAGKHQRQRPRMIDIILPASLLRLQERDAEPQGGQSIDLDDGGQDVEVQL